jgi:transcriptional regulator with XRE-family HTH domain
MPEDTFAARLRKLRGAAGLTREALAQRAGVPYSTLLQIEQGRAADPRVSTAKKLAAALGVHHPNAIAELRATVVIPYTSTARPYASRRGS